MKPGSKKSKGHFGRFYALVDGGWLKVLTHLEQSMWLAYEKFADPDGVAYPDGETVAKLIGHSGKTHISAIRQSLVRRGLLEVLEPGGGRGNPCKVRLLDPKKVPDSDGGNVPDSGNVCAHKGSRNGGLKVPDFGDKGSRFGEPYKEEQTIEQTKEQTNVPRRAPRAAVKRAEKGDVENPKAVAKYPPGVWQRAREGITRAYTHAHGVAPIFQARGWKAWAEVFDALGGDLNELAAVVRAALREKQIGRWRGHPPWVVLEDLNYLRQKNTGHPPNDNAKPNASDRGEYAEPSLKLPIIVGGVRTGTHER